MELINAFRRAAQCLGITLEVHGADATRLGQVLRNVLENAIQASPSGGRIAVDVAAAGSESKPMLCVSIDDEGAGIPEKDRARIFDLLYTTKPDGTGHRAFNIK